MEVSFIKKHLKDLGFDIDTDGYERTKKAVEECAKTDDINSIEKII